MLSSLEQLLSKQEEGGYWVDPLKFYTDKYKGTVWNLILLAELGVDIDDERVKKACEFVLEHSYEASSGGFSVNYSTMFQGGLPSKVIPCLTGNMVYSLIKLGYLDDDRVQKGISWITSYQRADDGFYKDSVPDKYMNLKACFGKHSCFMGVVKSLKALAEIPEERRTTIVNETIEELVEFMLVHRLYKRSHNLEEVSKAGWKRFGFPLMYQTDVLEILGIMMKLEVNDKRMIEALKLVQSKEVNGQWILESTMNGKWLIRIGNKGEPLKYLTNKAKIILNYYKEML